MITNGFAPIEQAALNAQGNMARSQEQIVKQLKRIADALEKIAGINPTTQEDDAQ